MTLPKKNVKSIADLNSRILAFLIDVLIFFFLIFFPFSSIYYEVVGINVENLTVTQALNNSQIFSILMVGYFSCLLIFLFYLSSFEYLLKGSLGKKMLNLSVVGKSKKVSLKQVILRNLTKTLFFNFLFFDCFLMLFDFQKRRISDFLANTLVISNRKIIKKFKVVNEI